MAIIIGSVPVVYKIAVTAAIVILVPIFLKSAPTISPPTIEDSNVTQENNKPIKYNTTILEVAIFHFCIGITIKFFSVELSLSI